MVSSPPHPSLPPQYPDLKPGSCSHPTRQVFGPFWGNQGWDLAYPEPDSVPPTLSQLAQIRSGMGTSTSAKVTPLGKHHQLTWDCTGNRPTPNEIFSGAFGS